MNLRRDTSRNLLRAFDSLDTFVTAVGIEIATNRIKAKTGEKLILTYWNNIEKVKRAIDKALGGGIFY
jgi:hypothetical protein